MRMSQGYDEAAAGTPLDRRWGREGFSQLMVADLIHGAAAALWRDIGQLVCGGPCSRLVRSPTGVSARCFMSWQTGGRRGFAEAAGETRRGCMWPCGGRESKFLEFGYIAVRL